MPGGRVHDVLSIQIAIQKGLWQTVNRLIRGDRRNLDTEIENGKTILYFAVETGNINVVESILRHKPNITSKGNKNAFMYSVNNHNINYKKIMNRLFQYGFNLDSKHLNQHKLLRIAFAKENCELIEYILKNAKNIQKMLSKCQNFLHTAVKKGYWNIVKMLINFGSDINAKDRDGKTALHYALERSLTSTDKFFLLTAVNDGNDIFSTISPMHKEVIEVLLEHPDIDLTLCDKNGKTPINYIVSNKSVFIHSSEEKKIEIIKMFLAKGVDVNFQNGIGIPILHEAVENGFEEIVKFLLSSNADTCAVDKFGQTALHIAVDKAWSSIVKVLLCYTININSVNRDGNTILYSACKASQETVVKALLEQNADVNQIQKLGGTALHAVTFSGVSFRDTESENIVEHLLKYKADPNYTDHNGCTPLHYACEGTNTKVVKMLLNNRAEVNVLNNDGLTPLHNAIERGHLALVKMLLQHRAKIDFDTAKGPMPLLIAVKYNYVKIVNQMLHNGAYVDARDLSGKTALQVACSEGHANVVKLLLLYGADLNVEDENGFTPLSSLMQDLSVHHANPENSHLDYENVKSIVIMLVFHTVLMNTAGIYVSEKNLQIIPRNLRRKSANWRKFCDSCKKELNHLKKKIKNTNISYFDILVKDMHTVSIYAKNKHVLRNFDRIFSKKCPYYSDFIYIKFCRGRFRFRLLEKSSASFSILFPNLPKLCVEKIGSYLNDNDLINLTGVQDLEKSKVQGSTRPLKIKKVK